MAYQSLCFAVLLSIATVSVADTLNLDKYLSNHSVIATINNDRQIQENLADILGKDYTTFMQNFDVLSTPYHLKTAKAIFIEGRKQNSKDMSAMTLYADGRIYASYYHTQTNILRYFTNDKSCVRHLHLTMQVFKKHFPTASVDYMTSNNHPTLKYRGNPAYCPDSTDINTTRF